MNLKFKLSITLAALLLGSTFVSGAAAAETTKEVRLSQSQKEKLIENLRKQVSARETIAKQISDIKDPSEEVKKAEESTVKEKKSKTAAKKAKKEAKKSASPAEVKEPEQSEHGKKDSIAAEKAPELKAGSEEVKLSSPEPVQEKAAPVAAAPEKKAEAKSEAKSSPIEISGYMQYLYTDQENNAAGTGGSGNISRARLILKKQLDDKTQFYTQLNGNTTTAEGAQFQIYDMYTKYNFTPDTNIQIGQFSVPNGFQLAVTAPKDIYMINAGQAYGSTEHETTVANDSRDRGLMINYAKKGSQFNYALAIVDGEGINNDSIIRNDNKSVHVRIGYEPLSYLKFGVFGSEGRRYKAAVTDTTKAAVASSSSAYVTNAATTYDSLYGTKAGATAAGDFLRRRAGIDMRYKKDKWTLQGEYQWLETGLAGRISNLIGRGGFVEAGYLIRPKLDLTAKTDVFTPNTNDSNTKKTVNAGGFNWYLNKTSKFQFVYESKKETPETKNDKINTLFTLEF